MIIIVVVVRSMRCACTLRSTRFYIPMYTNTIQQHQQKRCRIDPLVQSMNDGTISFWVGFSLSLSISLVKSWQREEESEREWKRTLWWHIGFLTNDGIKIEEERLPATCTQASSHDHWVNSFEDFVFFIFLKKARKKEKRYRYLPFPAVDTYFIFNFGVVLSSSSGSGRMSVWIFPFRFHVCFRIRLLRVRACTLLIECVEILHHIQRHFSIWN